ncbi:hypothetical protein E4U42_002802 [Claviceps africana]|uniref:Uncharacterized protein n=1 Tax=Claviceps africana TaxID=83212 RepID=A0A8K0NIC3_9HYPO|nr:hypothetical protein E4U42_002802 [Claviceps africana]
MSLRVLEELVSNGYEIKEDIWECNKPDFDFGQALKIISELKTQLEVHNVLLATVKLLSQCRNDEPLPGQRATRLKHFMKFIFGPLTRTNRPPAQARYKRMQLRTLDCTALKLCGLSYTIAEIFDISREEFDILIAKLPNFARVHNLKYLLCRDDVNKAIHVTFTPEDEDTFKAFFHDRGDCSVATIPPNCNINHSDESRSMSSKSNSGNSPLMKRRRIEQSQESTSSGAAGRL